MCGVRYVVTLDIKMMRTLGTKFMWSWWFLVKYEYECAVIIILIWYLAWQKDLGAGPHLFSSAGKLVQACGVPHSQQPATQSDIVLIAFENLLGSCLHFNLILHTRVVRKVTFHLSQIKEDSKLFRRQWLRMCWHRRRGSIGGEVETPRLVDGDFSDRLGSSHVTPCGWRAFGHTDLGENNTTLSSTYCHKKVTMGFLAVSPISLNVERLD